MNPESGRLADTEADQPDLESAAAPSAHTLANGRANVEAYELYYRRMDATRRQKVALTSVEFETEGAVLVDQGFGTGATTYDLASLYPRNLVIGFDIDPHAVSHAQKMYQADNLEYRSGDVGVPQLPPASVDGFLNSSVWHEISSYATTNRFSLDHVRTVLDSQVVQLREGGKIVVRDFVRPDWPERVVLELPIADGATNGKASELSTAALFSDFVERFRCEEYPEGGIGKDVRQLAPSPNGWARFELPGTIAAEFVLRKDYRERWEEELLEQYTYMTQSEFEDEFRARGLRTHSMQIHNPWIVANRFEGKFSVYDLEGKRLPFPPTNFLIVGEKVPASCGVQLREESSRPSADPSYLSLECFRMELPGTYHGRVFELARRPNPTVDVVPWFEQDGSLQILVKSGYPRPILSSRAADSELDDARSSCFVSEHLSGPLGAEPNEPPQAAALRVLTERGGLSEGVHDFGSEHRYYSSPGAVDEQVIMVPVRIEAIDSALPLPHYSNLSTSGRFRPMDAHQIIRAGQVGGLQDARLEVSAYQILLAAGHEAGPWIGAEIDLSDRAPGASGPLDDSSLFPLAARRAFVPADIGEREGYFEIRNARFADIGRDGELLASVDLEYVSPTPVGNNTIAVLPLTRVGERVFAAVEIRDLPTAQLHEGSSAIATVPSFRLPRDCADMGRAFANASSRLAADFGLEIEKHWPLGGKFFPSAGVLPEAVYPHAAEVGAGIATLESTRANWRWVPLEQLISDRYSIRDLNLLVSVLRAGHALGLLRS